MKKIFFSAILSILYPVTALAGATSPGIYQAVSDLNIRSTPQLIENRINHFKKGNQVVVSKVLGGWCQITHPRHPIAFVKCSYLTNWPDSTAVSDAVKHDTDQPAITIPNPVIEQQHYSSPTNLLGSLDAWLNTDDLGNNYINDTFWNAQQKALFWDETAAFSDFQFFYVGPDQIYCRYSFSSANKAGEFLAAQCLGSNLTEVSSSIVQSKKIPPSISLPQVPFRDFVAKLQQSTQLQQHLSTFFPPNAQLSARFKLSKGEDNQLFWYLDLFDLNSGMLKTISLDANSPSAPLIY